MNEGAEGLGEFVVASCDTSRILEAIEAALDAVAQGIDRTIDFELDAPVLFRWDNRDGAALFEIGSNGIGIIAAIGEEHLGIRCVFVHQRFVAFESCASPAVSAVPIGRPSAFVRRWILVEKPPREVSLRRGPSCVGRFVCEDLRCDQF